MQPAMLTPQEHLLESFYGTSYSCMLVVFCRGPRNTQRWTCRTPACLKVDTVRKPLFSDPSPRTRYNTCGQATPH